MPDNFKILKALNTIQGLYSESEIPSLAELISKYDIENVDEIIEDFQEKFINLVEDEDLIDRILELVSSEDSVNNITNLVYVNLNKLKDLLEESLKPHVNENDMVNIIDEFQETLTEFLEDSKFKENFNEIIQYIVSDLNNIGTDEDEDEYNLYENFRWILDDEDDGYDFDWC